MRRIRISAAKLITLLSRTIFPCVLLNVRRFEELRSTSISYPLVAGLVKYNTVQSEVITEKF
jgi:hypothetical protein